MLTQEEKVSIRSAEELGWDLSVALVTEGEIARCKKPRNYEALDTMQRYIASLNFKIASLILTI